MIGERHSTSTSRSTPRRVTPPEDGSPLEMGAVIVEVPLDVAIDLTRRGLIEDAKTELALRRLAEL
jgi:ADP-ribose pyrophosphatase